MKPFILALVLAFSGRISVEPVQQYHYHAQPKQEVIDTLPKELFCDPDYIPSPSDKIVIYKCDPIVPDETFPGDPLRARSTNVI